MRAAQNQRIDSCTDHRIEVTMEDFPGHLLVQPSLFDERDEQWTGLAGHAHRRGQCLDRSLIGLTLDGRPRTDHTYVRIPGFLHSRTSPWSYHSDDRHL